jgi:hypothetical protein
MINMGWVKKKPFVTKKRVIAKQKHKWLKLGRVKGIQPNHFLLLLLQPKQIKPAAIPEQQQDQETNNNRTTFRERVIKDDE